MADLKGKVALVTGASSGMGAATASALMAMGAHVFAAQRRATEFDNICVDLSEPDAPAYVIDAVEKKAGRLDILINNAGVMREARVDETSMQDWTLQISLNLTAPFLLIRGAVQLMTDGGSIVNVGSIEGCASNPRHAAYGASKAGLHGLTRAVAVDLGPMGIRCNAVAPGWIDTDLNDEFIASMPDPNAFRAGLGDIHPLGRTGSPEEVAKVIVWLATDAASFVTGQVFTIDGGRTSKLSLP